MVDEKKPTKVGDETHSQSGGLNADPQHLLSLDELDSVIAEEDPEFLNSLTEISASDKFEIFNEGLSSEYTLQDEINRWKHSGWIHKISMFILPFLPSVVYFIKIQRTRFRLMWINWQDQLVHLILHGIPLLFKWSKKKVLAGIHAVTALNKKEKIFFAGLLVLTILGGAIIYRAATKGLFPKSEEMFISSLEEWSSQKFQYERGRDIEYFYDTPRIPSNILLLNKMVVNLRPSSQSGENPMGAFEFLLEGSAGEVMIEIKDRESEVRDLFLRTIEGMTYDQVSSSEGKKLLSETLRIEANRILTKGQVRRVYLKTAIAKP